MRLLISAIVMLGAVAFSSVAPAAAAGVALPAATAPKVLGTGEASLVEKVHRRRYYHRRYYRRHRPRVHFYFGWGPSHYAYRPYYYRRHHWRPSGHRYYKRRHYYRYW